MLFVFRVRTSQPGAPLLDLRQRTEKRSWWESNPRDGAVFSPTYAHSASFTFQCLTNPTARHSTPPPPHKAYIHRAASDFNTAHAPSYVRSPAAPPRDALRRQHSSRLSLRPGRFRRQHEDDRSIPSPLAELGVFKGSRAEPGQNQPRVDGVIPLL